jgi:hypothetical protein
MSPQRSGQQKSKPTRGSWPGRPALQHVHKGRQRKCTVGIALPSYLSVTEARSAYMCWLNRKGRKVAPTNLPSRQAAETRLMRHKGSRRGRQVSEISFTEDLYADEASLRPAASRTRPRGACGAWTDASKQDLRFDLFVRPNGSSLTIDTLLPQHARKVVVNEMDGHDETREGEGAETTPQPSLPSAALPSSR